MSGIADYFADKDATLDIEMALHPSGRCRGPSGGCPLCEANEAAQEEIESPS
jgi:hypothetical protein